MKKAKNTFKIYLIFIIVSIFAYSCCDVYNYQIMGSGHITSNDFTTNNIFREDEVGLIKGAFSIDVVYELLVTDTNFQINLLPTAVAESCFGMRDTYRNELIKDSFKVTSNKAFTYNGQRIESGTNLTNIDDIFHLVFGGRSSIVFEEKFIENASFVKDVYQFNFEIMTSDGKKFTNSIKLRLDIEAY